MNLRVPYRQGISWPDKEAQVSQKGFWSIALLKYHYMMFKKKIHIFYM
jgi:hypothetical protein